MRRVSHEEWCREGMERYGSDPANWRWRCPSCGMEQGVAELRAVGLPARQIDQWLAFSCVGRLRPSHEGVVEFMEESRGHGCKYAGGGLFRINPVLVQYGGGERPTFEWAS